MKRLILAITAAASLSACAAYEGVQEVRGGYAGYACQSMGFPAGSDAHTTCMIRLLTDD